MAAGTQRLGEQCAREPIISDTEVYIPFASKGMVHCLQHAKHHFLKMVVDAKQKVLSNRWSILTIGFIVLRQSPSTTSARLWGKRVQLQMHCATMQPILQAIIRTESGPFLKYAFEDAIKLCLQYGQLDLVRYLIQVHKDDARGIEEARWDVFPLARAMEDYFHMLQRVTNTLPTKLRKQSVVPEEPHPEDRVEPPAEERDPGNKAEAQEAGVRQEPHPEGTVKPPAEERHERSEPEEPSAHAAKNTGKEEGQADKEKYYKMVMDLIGATRFLPSVQLFDCIWRAAFHELREVLEEPDAAEYLCNTYFHEVPLQVAAIIYKRVSQGCWRQAALLLGGFWCGVLGTAPDTGSGMQTIEARHSDWQAQLERRTRSDIYSILPCMQELYDHWEDICDWGRQVSFSNTPREFSATLVNGASLRRLGRSTAME